jgi:hypothetical protein
MSQPSAWWQCKTAGNKFLQNVPCNSEHTYQHVITVPRCDWLGHFPVLRRHIIVAGSTLIGTRSLWVIAHIESDCNHDFIEKSKKRYNGNEH